MADAVFYALMVVTIGGALFALEARDIVYGAVGLAGSLFGVASLFFLLDAPFVAVFQIAVYIGAVAVLILFTVMLVRETKWAGRPTNVWGVLVGAITAAALALALVASFAASGVATVAPQPTAPSFVEIGKMISGSFSPALEVLALVLAASVLGAITLAKVERSEDQ